jgi:hypothetical protein
VSYLGTSPPSQQFLSPLRNQNYEQMNDDYHRLLGRIESQGESDEVQEPQEALSANSQVLSQPQYESLFYEANEFVGQGGSVLATKGLLEMNARERVEKIQVTVQCPNNIVCREAPLTIESIESGSASNTALTFITKSGAVPTSLDIHFHISYAVNLGERMDYRSTTTTLRLPFAQIAKCVAPIDAANFKITLTAVNPVQLDSLLGHIVTEFVSANAASFTYFNDSFVTIIVNTAGDKYRIQGSHLEAIWLLVEEIYISTKG